MRRSVWAVRLGIYGPGFSKADWMIPLSRESVNNNILVAQDGQM